MCVWHVFIKLLTYLHPILATAAFRTDTKASKEIASESTKIAVFDNPTVV